jgi:peptide/nickel transport system ATP-binding protein
MAPAEELFAAPRHPYTRLLLDALPNVAMTGRTREPIRGEPPDPVAPPPGCAFHRYAYERCRSEVPALMQRREGAAACHAVEAGRT